MGTPPTFVTEDEVADWTSTTTPRNLPAFSPAAGDLLLAFLTVENTDGVANDVSITNGPTWSNVRDQPGTSGADCCTRVMQAIAAGGSITPSISNTVAQGAPDQFGGNVLEFSNHSGIGATAGTAAGVTGTHPTLAITTQQDNSAIAVIFADFTAAAVPNPATAYDQVNGQNPTVQTGQQSAGRYTILVVWYADAGAAGSKTVGVTFATSADTMIIAVEVKGPTAGAGTRSRGGPGHRRGPRTRMDILRAHHRRTRSTETVVATGITVVDTAIETDTALALTTLKTATLELAIETDTATALTAVKTVALALAIETDTAFAVTWKIVRLADTAIETDTALALTALKTITLALATETDTAFALTAVKTVLLAFASETDTAFALTAAKTVTLAIAVETDTAFTVSRFVGVNTALETDTAFALTSAKVQAITVAVETDTALALTRVKTQTLALAVETDTALAVVWKIVRLVITAVETDTAVPLTPVKTRILALATETDTAFAVSLLRSFVVATAVEVDTAIALVVAGGAPQFVHPFDTPRPLKPFDGERGLKPFDTARGQKQSDAARGVKPFDSPRGGKPFDTPRPL